MQYLGFATRHAGADAERWPIGRRHASCRAHRHCPPVALSSPRPQAPAPPPCSAFAVFFYLHMDNLDGKQARRTKNSSPLGQLFDHGEAPGLPPGKLRTGANFVAGANGTAVRQAAKKAG